jgi:predicted dehydrogenase
MSKKLRIGIIGCGMVAKRLHVPDYDLLKDSATIVAFCDVVVAKAKGLAKTFAPRAKVYKNWKEMLKAEKLDGVHVCLPNYLHAPVTIAALKSGANVIVEKPMAASEEEAQEMCDTAKKKGKLLMVNQSQRLFPAHVKAKEVLDSGIMGRIMHITAVFGHGGPEGWSPDGKWFFDKKKARFGAMADLGVHKADILRWLTGLEITSINAHMATVEKENTDVEDNFVSSFMLSNGGVGTLASSWTVKGAEANYTVFHCVNGTLRVCFEPGLAAVAYMSNPECRIEFKAAEAASNEGEGAWGLGIATGFVNAVNGIVEPYCTGEEGMRSLRVILAAEKSALTGKTIKLKH